MAATKNVSAVRAREGKRAERLLVKGFNQLAKRIGMGATELKSLASDATFLMSDTSALLKKAQELGLSEMLRGHAMSVIEASDGLPLRAGDQLSFRAPRGVRLEAVHVGRHLTVIAVADK